MNVARWRLAAALGVGLLFGAGLIVAGMANPAKIIGFLDVAGGWDPSLIVVMAAALAVSFAGYRLVLRRPKPVLESEFHLPTKTAIDRPLVIGSALFGIGWGMGGFCPGPGVTALAFGGWPALIFVAAMLAGMWARGLVRL